MLKRHTPKRGTNVATDKIQTIWPQSPLKCKPLYRVVRTCWTCCCYPLTISTPSYAERCTCCLELGYPSMPAGICICFYAKEQQLYTELLLDVWAPQPVSKSKTSRSTEEPLFQLLGSMTLSFHSLPRAHDHRLWSKRTQAGKSRALSCNFFLDHGGHVQLCQWCYPKPPLHLLLPSTQN